jgi:hypothetical protein
MLIEAAVVLCLTNATDSAVFGLVRDGASRHLGQAVGDQPDLSRTRPRRRSPRGGRREGLRQTSAPPVAVRIAGFAIPRRWLTPISTTPVRAPRAARARRTDLLHEITALSLATQVLEEACATATTSTPPRSTTSSSAASPRSASRAADIARTAVLTADYAESVAGVQINRFCASGLEAVNMATPR